MAAFLGPDVWTSITAAARANPGASQVAVAYFGIDGPRLLPLKAGSTLVVDASVETVSTGGTAPAALHRMLDRGIRIFSAHNLHAKVFVFGNRAFVGSANASANSSRYLLEAVASFHEPGIINTARAFVSSLAITELDAAALVALGAIYRPQRPPAFPRRQARFTTLIMQLTREQGAGRETQVQPPRAVWEHYFGIDFDAAQLPRLRLTNKGPQPAGPAPGTISRHDHNLTVEIPGAEMPRPALLELRKTGRHSYVYEVHRAGADFERFRQLLETRSNPLWTHGRRWLII